MSDDLRGKLLQLCGIVLLAIAFFMDTTVNTGMGSVYNIGLLAKQNNLYLLGGVALIAGIIFDLHSKKEPNKEQTEAKIEEDSKADRESDELEQRRAADEAIYIQSGEKFQLSNFDYSIVAILLILAALQTDQAWWRIVAFLIPAGGLFSYKQHIFKKKIIAEMKAKNIEPIADHLEQTESFKEATNWVAPNLTRPIKAWMVERDFHIRLMVSAFVGGSSLLFFDNFLNFYSILATLYILTIAQVSKAVHHALIANTVFFTIAPILLISFAVFAKASGITIDNADGNNERLFVAALICLSEITGWIKFILFPIAISITSFYLTAIIKAKLISKSKVTPANIP